MLIYLFVFSSYLGINLEQHQQRQQQNLPSFHRKLLVSILLSSLRYMNIYIYIYIAIKFYLFIYKLLINMIRREEMVLEDQFIARRMVITAQEVSKRSITVFMKITMDLKITSPSTIELFLLLF